MPKFHVGTSLRDDYPTDFLQRPKDAAGSCTGPLAHADMQSILIDFGTACDFSTSSAMDLKAKA